MQQIPRFILIIFLIACCFNRLSAQVDSSVVSEIRLYVTHLDSLNKLVHPWEFGYTTSIVDGIIKKDEVTIGGFDISTLSKAKGDTVLIIEYHDNVDINIYKSYYFKADKLVYAIVELQEGRKNVKTIYRKEEFYNDNTIVLTTIQKDKHANRYFDKINISLYEEGLNYLLEFKEGKLH